MSQTNVAFEGNLASDVEVSYTRTGKPVARFPVMVNRRRQDPDTGDWVDDEPTRHSCTAFGSLGQHIAESLARGDRVVVMGGLVTDSWADRDTGEKRTAQRVLVDAAGPSLRWATAQPHKDQAAAANTDQVDRDRDVSTQAEASAISAEPTSVERPAPAQTETAVDEPDAPADDSRTEHTAAASVERARHAVGELKQRTTAHDQADTDTRTGDTTRTSEDTDGLSR